jgi:hypothetical protein
MSESAAAVKREKEHRSSRRRNRGDFLVVRHLSEAGEEVYLLVAPTGVQLYTFEDIREATAEAAELNKARAALSPRPG